MIAISYDIVNGIRWVCNHHASLAAMSYEKQSCMMMQTHVINWNNCDFIDQIVDSLSSYYML